jgi:2-oxo-4-hydroxy-4-carboxy-5-ureidoimidazoline decarboxylase
VTLAELTACCGSSAWANAMFARQPFPDAKTLHQAADEVWWSLTDEDWLEAFSKHPKIGQASIAKWPAQEQSGLVAAAERTIEELARLNAEYAARFGFIFIVCATGKSAAEVLELLRSRINHSRAEEIRIAAAEQAKITHLRLDKLLTE